MTRVAFVMMAFAGLQLGFQRSETPAGEPQAAPISPWFEDATERDGLDFVHDSSSVFDDFMPQQSGLVAALFDFNELTSVSLFDFNRDDSPTDSEFKQRVAVCLSFP